MKKHEVKKIGDSHVINVPNVGVFMYPGTGATTTGFTEDFTSSQISWEADKSIVQGKEVVPYGVNNNLPVEIRRIMDENNLASGILEREIGLLHGLGYRLYKEELDVEKNEFVRKWIQDNEIQDWLESWQYEKYLDMATVEYKYLKGHFTKFYRNRGPRIGRDGKIMKLACVPGADVRLQWVDSRRLEDVKNVIVGDFENDCTKGIQSFPVFQPEDPFSNPVSILYSNMYSFCRNFYSVPSYYGSLNWIKRSSDIPQIIKSLTDNGINPGYMISSPSKYWESKENMLREKCELEGKAYNPQMLEDLKNETLEKIGSVLGGKTNVGKFFHTVSFMDEMGKTWEWKVTPIEKDLKNFIEAQIKISEKADSATTSGIGLHPSLSNIMVDGKLSSGSEMLYALKLYIASDTTIPERIITEPLNMAIKANFPDRKGLKIGFYRNIVMTEENVSPQDRVTKKV